MCNRKAKASTETKQSFSIRHLKNVKIIIIMENKNALNNDGENPANHTKSKMPENFAKGSYFFPNIFEYKSPVKEAIKERCIPLNARIWESPALRKAFSTSGIKYSREPESSDIINPPALPQDERSRLKALLQTALIL